MAATRAVFRLPKLTLATLAPSSLRSTSSRLSPQTCTSACFNIASRTAAYSSSSTSSASADSPQTSGDLIDELDARGLIQTLTSRSLRTHLGSAPRTVYSGVDPSAPSLHVGNLLPLFTLVHFARHQHRPIVLVGGATGSIGDPSGRSTERNALDKETLQANVDGIKAQLRAFFKNVAEYYSSQGGLTLKEENLREEGQEGVELGMGVRLMNNYDWMSGVTLLDFLGSVGRHARLTQMLARESVASRLSPTSPTTSGGMSYTEFSYQLLQAYDFSHLHDRHNCTIQLGGSDQLGNITAGIDLIRRTSGGLNQLSEDPAYGLTLPLLTTSSGEKFGKSAGNAVWLDSGRTSDLDFYQFFLRSSDADVARYLHALTLLSPQYVQQVIQDHCHDKSKRTAQRILAHHITALIRGKHAAAKCETLTSLLFSHTSKHHADPTQTAKDALRTLDLTTITEQDNILTELEKSQVVEQDLTKVVVSARLVKTRAEAKRLLASGGLYVNNRQLATDRASITEQDLVPVQAPNTTASQVCLLRTGKSAVRILHITN